MTRPDAVVSSDSFGRTTMRSSRGCRSISDSSMCRSIELALRPYECQRLVGLVGTRNRRVPTPESFWVAICTQGVQIATQNRMEGSAGQADDRLVEAEAPGRAEE